VPSKFGLSFLDGADDSNFQLILKMFSCGHVEKEDDFFLLDSSLATEKPPSDLKFVCVR